ncbi:MAG: restriction endonuclease subunit S [Actinobacteria bacterium]|nr:MAG: restriction endonuclease subunit S [Actinomycetota bacterium]
MKAFPVPAAPLEEQRRIVAEVEERLSVIDAMRASITRAQRRSAALRRSILERAFRGELVPQDPSDEPASVLLDRIRAEHETAPTYESEPSDTLSLGGRRYDRCLFVINR